MNLTDIEFMLDCCMSSTFKIFQVQEEEGENLYMSTGLGDFVIDNFNENIKIDYSKVSQSFLQIANIQALEMVLQK